VASIVVVSPPRNSSWASASALVSSWAMDPLSWAVSWMDALVGVTSSVYESLSFNLASWVLGVAIGLLLSVVISLVCIPFTGCGDTLRFTIQEVRKTRQLYKGHVMKAMDENPSEANVKWARFEGLFLAPMIVLEGGAEWRSVIALMAWKTLGFYHTLFCEAIPNALDWWCSLRDFSWMTARAKYLSTCRNWAMVARFAYGSTSFSVFMVIFLFAAVYAPIEFVFRSKGVVVAVLVGVTRWVGSPEWMQWIDAAMVVGMACHSGQGWDSPGGPEMPWTRLAALVGIEDGPKEVGRKAKRVKGSRRVHWGGTPAPETPRTTKSARPGFLDPRPRRGRRVSVGEDCPGLDGVSSPDLSPGA
jgi:hypothetical protein